MDAVVGLLDGVRARGAFVLRMTLDPPWSMRIQDDAPLTLICQTHGRAVIVGDGSGTVWLNAGDVALTRGTEHYVFADDPGHHADGRHPPRQPVYDAVRRRPSIRDVARGPDVGQQCDRRNPVDHLRVRGA